MECPNCNKSTEVYEDVNNRGNYFCYECHNYWQDDTKIFVGVASIGEYEEEETIVVYAGFDYNEAMRVTHEWVKKVNPYYRNMVTEYVETWVNGLCVNTEETFNSWKRFGDHTY